MKDGGRGRERGEKSHFIRSPFLSKFYRGKDKLAPLLFMRQMRPPVIAQWMPPYLRGILQPSKRRGIGIKMRNVVCETACCNETSDPENDEANVKTERRCGVSALRRSVKQTGP